MIGGMTGQVRVRPVSEADLPLLRRLSQDPQAGGRVRVLRLHREGVLRGIRWRGGAWRDELLYSILRSDPRC